MDCLSVYPISNYFTNTQSRKKLSTGLATETKDTRKDVKFVTMQAKIQSRRNLSELSHSYLIA